MLSIGASSGNRSASPIIIIVGSNSFGLRFGSDSVGFKAGIWEQSSAIVVVFVVTSAVAVIVVGGVDKERVVSLNGESGEVRTRGS